MAGKSRSDKEYLNVIHSLEVDCVAVLCM